MKRRKGKGRIVRKEACNKGTLYYRREEKRRSNVKIEGSGKRKIMGKLCDVEKEGNVDGRKRKECLQ